MQFKVLMVLLVGFLGTLNLPQTAQSYEGEDLGSGTFIGKIFKTPGTHPELFDAISHSDARRNIKDKSIWEPDYSSHGGEQYKRWNNEKAWEKGKTPTSVWFDGRIRNAPKS